MGEAGTMTPALKRRILGIMDGHRSMTVATVRPDGWPQATTVGYANDGLTLYFLCGRDSQKAENLARDDRVSITIDDDTPEVLEISGLSLAAHARPVADRAEAEKAIKLLMSRYPEQKAANLPEPSVDDHDLAIFRVTPTVVSVLDYAKGFGHTDLVAC